MAESDGGGLYGSDTGANMVRSASAELIGTAVLVFAGTAVAVGAILGRPTAGGSYDSLAVALAFGITLVALVGALGHVSGAHLNPAVTLALARSSRGPSCRDRGEKPCPEPCPQLGKSDPTEPDSASRTRADSTINPWKSATHNP